MWFVRSCQGAMKQYNNYGGVIYSMKNVKWLKTLRVDRLYITWLAIWRLLRNMPILGARMTSKHDIYIKKNSYIYALCTAMLQCFFSCFIISPSYFVFTLFYAKGNYRWTGWQPNFHKLCKLNMSWLGLRRKTSYIWCKFMSRIQ